MFVRYFPYVDFCKWISEKDLLKNEKRSAECLQRCNKWMYNPILMFNQIDEKLVKNRCFVHNLYENFQ